jgi:hypothetical protein
MRTFYKDVLLGIPAALMVIGLTTMAIASLLARDTNSGRYFRMANIALQGSKYPWALKCYVKAESLGAFDPRLQFEKAICLLMLTEIHYRRGKQTPDELDKVIKVLKELEVKNPNSVMLQKLLVETQSRSKGVEAALPHLVRLATYSLEDRLKLAIGYSMANKKELAEKESRLVRDDVQRQLDVRPKDFATRLIGIRACVTSKAR